MLRYISALLIAIVIPLLAHQVEAANCEAGRTAISAAALSTTVQLPDQKSVAANGMFTIGWRRGEVAGLPIYLMISFDRAVRFEGDGFYALLPNATAAFGIAQGRNKTRAIVPFYGYGAKRSGAVTVRPLQAGPMQIEWAVVGFDGCAEYSPAGRVSGAFQIHVQASGQPQIVVADEVTGEAPRQRIYSPAGDRVIEVHDDRYRLIEANSGAEIVERPGTTPRFSPTGRYVAAYAEDGVEIIDTVDGGLIFKNAIGFELAWDNADSFAALNRGKWGSITIIAPTRGDPVVVEGSASCHGCNGIDNVALKVDLENGVAVYNGDQGTGAGSLTRKVKAPLDGSGREFADESKEILAFVKRQPATFTFKLPKRWELHGGLKFSHLGAEAINSPAATNPLSKFLVNPLLAPIAPAKQILARRAGATQWRGFGIIGQRASVQDIFARLEDFGVPLPEQADKPETAQFTRERKLFAAADGQLSDVQSAAIRKTARQIEQEVTVARGAFVGDVTDGGLCRPEGSGNYAETQLYERFQRAFRFQNARRVIWLTHQMCGEGSAAFHYPTAVLFDSAAASSWLLHSVTKDSNEGPADSCYSDISFCEFEAEIFEDKYLVLSSRESRAIEIFDLNTREKLFKKYGLPRGDLLERALLSADRKSVIQVNSDGTFAVFRFAEAELLFQGRYVDDEIVIWTPGGQFDATSEGAHYVSLRLPGRPENYTFEQFTAQLKTPGLIAKRFAGEELRGIGLTSPPALSGTIQPSGAKVLIKARADGDVPIVSLLIYEDGLLTNRLPGEGVNPAWDVQITPLKGTRWISLVAVDRSGLASLPLGHDMPPSAPRRTHLLAIGVDKYSDSRIPPLNLAQSDARRFEEALQMATPKVDGAVRSVIADQEATRDGIVAKLREAINAAEPGDTLALFFAGHGVRGASGDYFLATSDTNVDDIEGSALSWTTVAEHLKQSRTRIAIFLDACHSGAAQTRGFETNDAAAQSLLERIPSSIVVFSASKGRQVSEESSAAGGGVFTSSLINVIARDRTRFDANNNTAIEISELYRGVKSQVKTMTGNTQTPWLARNQMVGDFSLF